LAFNCVPDFARIGCSSFCVWGALSADGNTLTGRNLDWFTSNYSAMGQMNLIIVQAAQPERGVLGWVSVTWPGLIVNLTGMNSEGVTVCVQDSAFGYSWRKAGSTPRGFTLREAIETAHPTTAFDDVARILRAHHCVIGNNIPVTVPYDGHTIPS